MNDRDIRDIAADSSFKDSNDSSKSTNAAKQVIIKAVGVGGGGNNAVDHMFKQGIEDVSFVVCNTDKQALQKSPVKNQVLLGPNVTFGLGAGNNPEVARKAAEESAAEISNLFDDGTKMVFITAGMGGGTGTGAAPVVARIAKEHGLLTIGIVTIPFLFEGEKKILKALDGADEMAKYVDALLVINNERLTEIYSDLDFMNAFRKADDTLTTAARSIAEIITCEGHINLDFNDVNTTLRNGGAAIISSGYGEGENRVTKAIHDALNSPLLKNRDIFGSKKLLFNLYFNPNANNQFLMQEASELSAFMSNLDPSVDVIWGVAIDPTLGEQVKITILAAGFDVTIRDDEDDIKLHSGNAISFGSQTAAAQAVKQGNGARIEDEYGTRIDYFQNEQIRQKCVIMSPNQLDDDETIDALDQTPTYNRDKKVSQHIKDTASTPATPAEKRNSAGDANIINFD